MLYRLLRLRINKRTHASYYYKKYNHQSQTNNKDCLADLNTNLEKVTASLRLSDDEDTEIGVPSFSELDYDYIEINLNRDVLTDWYHTTLLKNELEYFGRFVDGERVVSTHGHFQKPIKACLLDLIDPNIVSEKGESHVYQVLRMVSFEPEPPEKEEEEKPDEPEKIEEVEKPEPVFVPPPAPKIRFKRRRYDLTNLELDREAPVFEFKIKEDEEAHRLLAKIRELASQGYEKISEIQELLKTNAPELAEKLSFIYDSACFGASLGWQTLQLIIQGNLFIPEQTCQTSNAWTDECSFSKNSRLSVADNFSLADEVLDARITSPVENFKVKLSEVETEIEYQEQQDFEEYVELSETEILPKLGTKQVYDRDSDYYYLVHYQLIHQISKLPTYLKPFADDPEYYYHSFVLFNPHSNTIQVIRKGVDDEAELVKLRRFVSEEQLEFNYVAFQPNKMKHCNKYYSVMMLRPSSEQTTCYVSTYTDENAKLVGWESWLQRIGLERGIKEVHLKTNQTNNPTAISGTAIEHLLKFVEESTDD